MQRCLCTPDPRDRQVVESNRLSRTGQPRELIPFRINARAASLVTDWLRPRPTAVGYICREVSGIRQEWDESRIRSLAARFGYDYAKTIVLSSGTVDQLIDSVRRIDAEAVFVPSEAHFIGSRVPAELVRVADVNTVDSGNTYARWIDTAEANAAACGYAVHLAVGTEQRKKVQSG